MIPVNHAVLQAIEAAKQFFIGKELHDLELEEVEMSEDGKDWLITLGFYVKDFASQHSIAGMLQGSPYQRKYKIFRVKGDDGDVLSMKIRTP